MSRLFEQLKRRNVIRAAATYVALSWVLLQIVDLISPILGLPDRVMQVMAVVLVLGLIPAMIVSWIYEITPDGVQKEKELAEDAPGRQIIARKMNTVVAVLLLIAIGLLVLDRYFVPERGAVVESIEPQEAPAEKAPIRSIAVLPFDDFSAAGDQGYLGDGIADTVLHMLAGVKGLKVAARTSSFSFRDDKADIRTIGNRLGVDSVLEGSVQVAGEQLRIIAQLVRVSDQSHIWSRTFDRPREDVFAIQDEIANAVVARFAGDEQVLDAPIESNRTSPDVYALVLQARQLTRNRNVPDIERAIELLNRAIDLDTAYAPAHSEMAAAIFFNSTYGASDLEKTRQRIESEIRTALQLDPNDAAAYATRGALWSEHGEPDKARADYERALELNPGDVEVMTWLAELLLDQGEIEAARDLLRRSYETDPLNIKSRRSYALYLIERENDADQAIAIAEQTIALDLDPAWAYRDLAIMYTRVSRLADIAPVFLESARHDPESPASYMTLAIWFAFLEVRELSRAWWNVAIALRPPARHVPDFLYRNFFGEGDLLLAEVEQQLATNPDAPGLLQGVISVAAANGNFQRSIELGERYFELAEQRGGADAGMGVFVAYVMAMVYRVQGLDEEADYYAKKLELMLDLENEQSSILSSQRGFERMWLSLAHGDYGGAARVLETLPVGKPIAYHFLRDAAFTRLAREDPSIQAWMAGYAEKIAAARDALSEIEDPALRNPELLRERARAGSGTVQD
jgi:TolB-like protein/Flp pilus assembly protein TadD